MNDVMKKLQQEMNDILQPAKHTKLPWKRGNGGVVYTEDLRYLVANLSNLDQNLSSDVEKANADFIVKACNSHDDLVAALEALLARFIGVCLDADGNTDPADIKSIDQCRTALKRAKGEA